MIERDTSEDALGERLLHVLALFERADGNAADGAAIERSDDRVLRGIDESPREITGVCRFKSGVRQTLTCAVRRDKIFEDRKSLVEIRDDRVFDEFARLARKRFLRLGHKPAHTRKLANLLFRSASAGIDHHIERVKS